MRESLVREQSQVKEIVKSLDDLKSNQPGEVTIGGAGPSAMVFQPFSSGDPDVWEPIFPEHKSAFMLTESIIV